MRASPGKTEMLVLLASAWMVLACNAGFWNVATHAGADGSRLPFVHLLSIGFLAIGLTSVVFLSFAVGRLLRPVLALALVAASLAGYFAARYGIVIDGSMLANVVETDSAEAAELISPRLLVTVTALGVVPAIMVLRYRLPRRRLSQALTARFISVIVAAGLVAAPLYFDQKAVVSIVRNHRELGTMLAPVNLIAATYAYLREELRIEPEFRHVALDAVIARTDETDTRPNVHVVIVGETARATSFSLNDYARNTNPSLAKLPVVNFSHVEACGTATAQSVPCMFSIQPMSAFDRTQSEYEDNLLDIASRAGYDVYWIDNGNSCKGVCARVKTRDVSAARDRDDCDHDRCYDEELVTELERVLPTIDSPTLIVLHQLGSHGPAYYRRYPDTYRRFRPDCRDDDFGTCSVAEIRNAYDNTILYTDHVIARVVDVLSRNSDRIAGSMLYISDHGESLGEHDLFLHGMPRRFAPEEQTHVPMIAWLSPETMRAQTLAADCGEAIRHRPASHDNLFHTELGLLRIRTSAYVPALDVFDTCRRDLHANDRARTPATNG